MIVPAVAKYVAAAAGAVLVLFTLRSVVGTVVVPRMVRSSLTRVTDRVVDAGFHVLTMRVRDPLRHDRILAAVAPVVLIGQLLAWLVSLLVGFALLMWPFASGGIGLAFASAASAMTASGVSAPTGAGLHELADAAAMSYLVTVALQIGYLPALYGAFNRRETEVTLLYARAGLPAWGPELLARTHYGFATGESTLAELPDFFARWERWAADVAESHVTYPPLARFRSPEPLASWVLSLLAVLDSAALFLALAPSRAPTIPARLCLRMGFTCFVEVARALGADVPREADPSSGTTLTQDDFHSALRVLNDVGFPVERPLEQAWADFVGWRVNYERAAYAVAAAVDAPRAPWSGPRRRPAPMIAPQRPRAPRPR